MVVVWRQNDQGRQFLVLHAADVAGDGDWAWRSPSGCAEDGESAKSCAVRELHEETGLSLDLFPVDTGGLWPVYVAQAPADADVVLSGEHDDFRWVSEADALALVKPDVVTRDLRTAVAHCV